MRTYEDLLALEEGNESAKIQFILSAIFDYKSSDMYKDAVIAYDYFRKRNVTISEYRKLLYTMSGEAVPDNYSANYKFCNAFFSIFVEQENSYLLGNGITFGEDSTKEKLGGDRFDNTMMELGEYALWGGVAYGFYHLDSKGKENDFGNLYLTDGTNELYVYGCYAGWGATGDARKFFIAENGIQVGDEISIIGYKNTYNELVELCQGVCFSFKKAGK